MLECVYTGLATPQSQEDVAPASPNVFLPPLKLFALKQPHLVWHHICGASGIVSGTITKCCVVIRSHVRKTFTQSAVNADARSVCGS